MNGEITDECNTKMIRHFTIESRYQNITRYVNETIINETRYVDTLKYTPYKITTLEQILSTGFSHIKNR